MSRRSVRGPHSALTNFLAEHGISAREIRDRHLQRRAAAARQETADPDAPGQQQVEGDAAQQDAEVQPLSVADELVGPTPTVDVAPPTTRRTRRAAATAAATATAPAVSATLTADGLAFLEVEVLAANRTAATGRTRSSRRTASSRTRQQQEQQQQQQQLEESSAQKKKKKKRRADDSDDDFDEDFVAPTSKKSGARRGPDVAFCSKCRCRYTVTVPQSSGKPKQVNVCPACTNDLNNTGASTSAGATSAAKRKRRKIASKLTKDLALLDDKEKGKIPSLRNICLAVIGENIHDVEALGDLSQINRDKLSQIISRHRELNNETARLFFGAGEVDVKLYDCTRMDEDGLCSIPMLAPNLTSLTLGYCGQMTGKVTSLIKTHLGQLTKLDLYGAFLVRSDAWYDLLANLPHLTMLSLAHTPGLDAKALGALSEVQNLQELRLIDVSGVNDDALTVLTDCLKPPQSIKAFELVRPANGENMTEPITPMALMDLIRTIGPSLEEIQLTECGLAVTDEVLVEGIARLCPRLVEVGISGMEGISSDALRLFFTVNAESVTRLCELEKDVRPAIGFQRIDFSRLGVPTLMDASNADKLLGGGVDGEPAASHANADGNNGGDEDESESQDQKSTNKAIAHANEGIDDSVLAVLSRHSAATLTELNINGADGLVCGLDALFNPDDPLDDRTEESRFVLTGPRPKKQANFIATLPHLRILDVSWIRSIDDDTLERLGAEAPNMEQVSVWGCHRITDCAKIPTPNGQRNFARIIGREREPIVVLGR